MAYTCVRSLFVLTLLQLCRAEISDSLPESWYSANVISDGFQPKPISEIFSTGPPFSTTNPIVVLPKESSSVPDEILLLSTLAPPRKISTTGSSEFTKISTAALESSTPLPPTFHTIPPSSVQTILPTSYQTTASTFLPSSTTFVTPSSTFAPPSSPFLPSSSTFLPSQSTTQQPPIVSEFTKETIPPSQSTISFRPEIQQTTLSLPQPQSPSISPQLSQQIRLDLVPQGLSIQTNAPAQNMAQPTAGPLSNYFLVYQQAPQSIQGLPTGTSQEAPQFSTAAPSTSTGTPATVIIQPAPTVSLPSTRTAPPSPTTPLPSTTRAQTRSTVRTNRGCNNVTNNLPASRLSELGPLRIRVLAPSGSITNVNFVSKTTTTKRPTTTRTRKTSKPKKNTYEFCIDGCRGKREPICAAPLSSTFLDPKTLKGFPSVCHMACHNSYRKDPFEKVLDGRCGRLRTRIKTVDSNTKLKREELNKAQYFLDNSGGKTIVEVSPLK
ncbi:mucin-2-like [Spodoptera litura]|uniref:Mucin-2-like n=1 Tax=Spodoptera litura TaxID=69820 RepID=A0A9J7EHY4_SPOLT|nr:mucin-2-like [Spodoptera litura]